MIWGISNNFLQSHCLLLMRYFQFLIGFLPQLLLLKGTKHFISESENQKLLTKARQYGKAELLVPIDQSITFNNVLSLLLWVCLIKWQIVNTAAVEQQYRSSFLFTVYWTGYLDAAQCPDIRQTQSQIWSSESFLWEEIYFDTKLFRYSALSQFIIGPVPLLIFCSILL